MVVPSTHWVSAACPRGSMKLRPLFRIAKRIAPDNLIRRISDYALRGLEEKYDNERPDPEIVPVSS